MNRDKFREELEKRFLVLDGAIGTFLQREGLRPDAMPEEAVFEIPDKLRDIHRMYVDAGADIILTDTLGGTPMRLAEYGLAERIKDVNTTAIRLAKEAAGDRAYVGLCVGPSGSFIKPVGDKTFDELYDNFRAQAESVKDELPDIIVFETFSDIHELKTAVIAFKDALGEYDLPFIAHLTFQDNGRTLTGSSPEVMAVALEALDLDAIGANCSVGPEEMVGVIRELGRSTNLPISVEPNAGLPEIVDGKPVYTLTAEKFATYIDDFVDAGAGIIGSCCGSTPEFTKLIANSFKGRKPEKRNNKFGFRIASAREVYEVRDDKPVRIIGERINPAGRKKFKEELREGKFSILKKEAIVQAEAGAAALDINVSGYKHDEKLLLSKAVELAGQYTSLPVLLDNSNPEVLEESLKSVAGKALINSISGEDDKLDSILPLAKKYGAAVIGICLDEKGIPGDVEGRMKIAQNILYRAEQAGLKKEDVVLDAIVLSVSTGPEQVGITLETLKKIKAEFGNATTLGISNISFGLPERQALGSAFLMQALEAGLDLPIVDLLDPSTRNVVFSYNLLSGRDAGGKDYIKEMSARTGGIKITEDEPRSADKLAGLTGIDKIRYLTITGEKDLITDAVSKTLAAGEEPLDIVNNALVPAMKEVGDKFSRKEYFLPQVLLAAETMKAGFAVLKDKIKTGSNGRPANPIIFATVKGDVHDLGKNIVITLLESYGYNVLDLGKNIDAETILARSQEEKALCIALSSLMTTTMGEMKVITERAREMGVKIPIVVGGAVVTKSYAEEIGAEYGRDAIEAVKVITGIEKGLLGDI
ncbi:MAG: homocysteine S-methyltransferase family protein [Acidobacteria bacterium]|nr:homocysteine S-methyltransferase family protein [Acidobacteriota bacterium]